jgi:hypothetical protein
MQALAKKQDCKSNTLRLNTSRHAQQGPRRPKNGHGQTQEGRHLLPDYSGHGVQVPNTGSDFEPDGFDATWCLYDGEWIDHKFFAALSEFAAGVRIFVLSDSCDSGTVLHDLKVGALGLAPVRRCAMARDIAIRVHIDHSDFFDGLQSHSPGDPRTKAKATGLLISGCQDNQTSFGGRPKWPLHRYAPFRLAGREIQRRLSGLLNHREVHAADAQLLSPWNALWEEAITVGIQYFDYGLTPDYDHLNYDDLFSGISIS